MTDMLDASVKRSHTPFLACVAAPTGDVEVRIIERRDGPRVLVGFERPAAV